MQKRFLDLSRLADRKGMVLFSNFLNLNEQSLFHQIVPDLKTAYQLSGGYEFAERQMVAFLPDAPYYMGDDSVSAVDFPIVCLHFHPSHPKFAETLSHRDVLGSLMGLGIERSRIGDIRLEGQDSYIFCEESISDYILQSLEQIRRTAVTGTPVNACACRFAQRFETLNGIVSSGRLDSIVAFALKISRDKSASYIQAQKVFVNEKAITSNAYLCREGDRISIRGSGKYIYGGSSGETKKGRMKIVLKKYS